MCSLSEDCHSDEERLKTAWRYVSQPHVHLRQDMDSHAEALELCLMRPLRNFIDGCFEESIQIDEFPISFRENQITIYSFLYRLMTQRAPCNFSREFYEYHNKQCKRLVQEKILPRLFVEHTSSPAFAQTFVQAWKIYSRAVEILTLVFYYLNRYYVGYHSLPTLSICTSELFYQEVFLPLQEPIFRSLSFSSQVSIDITLECISHISRNNIEGVTSAWESSADYQFFRRQAFLYFLFGLSFLELESKLTGGNSNLHVRTSEGRTASLPHAVSAVFGNKDLCTIIGKYL